MENDKVFVRVNDKESDGIKVIDRTEGKGNSFVFKGGEVKPEIATISIQKSEDARPVYLNVVLQNGNIKVKIDSVLTISGTPLNDSLQLISNINLYQDPYAKTFIENNKGNIVGAFALARTMSQYSLEDIEKILTGASTEFKDSQYGKMIQKYCEALKRSEIGATYTNLTMKDPEGNDISLSDYVGKGKYVLVDFWASWCGPCRREMPALVETYAKYKNKGFEVIGVSFDSDADAWKNALKSMNMTWPQMSDLKGWGCEAAEVYGIVYIPQTLLIDPEGKIIAKNIYGEAINTELEKYLK